MPVGVPITSVLLVVWQRLATTCGVLAEEAADDVPVDAVLAGYLLGSLALVLLDELREARVGAHHLLRHCLRVPAEHLPSALQPCEQWALRLLWSRYYRHATPP